MAKKRATAVELKAEIDRRIAESGALDGDCRDCSVSMPREVPPSARADYGWANWIADFVKGPAPCAGTVMRIRDQVMREYDCSDWT